ncbi:hypothetical protein BC831DRAFT_520935 [Entophlyctis helioformis]|nr:hypothetical protein BC831DRAFT_520935 [Entophlyctis helioformis]
MNPGGHPPRTASRESNNSLSLGRPSESRSNFNQSFSATGHAHPPQRSMRLNSIAVPRGTGNAGIVGRPIVWTKQATLQKNAGFMYASQPVTGGAAVSGSINVSHNSGLGYSNASSFPAQSSHGSQGLGSNSQRHPSTSSNSHVGIAGSNAHQNGHHGSSMSNSKDGVSPPGAVLGPSLSVSKSSRQGQRDSVSFRETPANESKGAVVLNDGPQVLSMTALSDGSRARTGSQAKLFSNSEHASAVSRPYRDILKKIGHPLRGPILVELAVHYFFFLLILFVAWKTSWAPEIRFYLAVVFFFVSAFAMNISRLIFTRFPNSCIPFYISFCPLALLIFISREAHQIVMMLWFISFLIIFLQSGHPDLFRHLLYFCVAYTVVYIAMLGLMVAVYKDGCVDLNCGVALRTPIAPLAEGVLMIECFFVMVIYSRLERFIKLNASTLLDRENYMQHLYIANMDLKRQLRTAKIENEVDLEAPLTRATQILNEVKDTQDLEDSIIEEIDFIIGLLSSDKLFQPDLFQNSNDTDVHDWLKDMLLADKSTTKPVADGVNAAQGALAPFADGARLMLLDSASPAGTSGLLLTDEAAFKMLEAVEDPEFDVFDLEIATSGHALYYLGWHLFRQHRLGEVLLVNEIKFRKLIAKIESGYRRSNPYHNSTHAADVTHAMNYFSTRSKIWSILKAEEQLAILIAPIIHDYMHPGVNNAFLIATSSLLALRYNDQSVLEHFHCSSFYELVSQDEYDILSPLSMEQRKTVRELVSSMVLATDMAFHFDWIGKFKSKLSGAGFNFENKADKKMVLNVAIKCADVNNPTKPQTASRRWTQLIMEEFFRQGDEEKGRGIPISTFMNRETTDIPKCQIGFIEFIVHPLYEAWANFMKEDVDVHMHNIQANKGFWKLCTDTPSLAVPIPIPTFNVTPLHTLGSIFAALPSSATAPGPAISRTETSSTLPAPASTIAPVQSGATSAAPPTPGSNPAAATAPQTALASGPVNPPMPSTASGQALVSPAVVKPADAALIEENPQSPGVDGTGHSGFPKHHPHQQFAESRNPSTTSIVTGSAGNSSSNNKPNSVAPAWQKATIEDIEPDADSETS